MIFTLSKNFRPGGVKNYFKKIVIFSLVLSWVLTGFPQIFNFPPKIQEAKAATQVLRPDGAGFYQEWNVFGSSHWEVTSDSNDASYIETSSNNARDIQALQDPTFDVSSTINSVTIYARVYVSGTGGAEKISFFDRLSTTDREGNAITVTRDSFNEYNSGALSTDPTGLAWTEASISNLQAGVRAAAIGASETLRTSEIWISVDYTYTPPPNQPPNAPTNVSPSDGTSDQSLAPTLVASVYSDPESDPHASSQWQITTLPGNYTLPVFDSGEDTVNLTNITVSPDLDHDTTYYWHVRYRDNKGNWSNYSSETSFSTIGAPLAINIEKGGGEEYNSGETASLMAQVKDVSGLPLNSASVTLNIYDPSKSKVIDGQVMSYIAGSNGLYYYDYVVSSTVGIYIFDIKATDASGEGYTAGTFHVSPLADNVAEKVWNYTGRSLDNIDNIVSGIWQAATSTMTAAGSIGKLLVDNIDDKISNIASNVWNFTSNIGPTLATNLGKAIWDYTGSALDTAGNAISKVWSYTGNTLDTSGNAISKVWSYATRKLTSRQIGENEYITGVSSTSTVSQVADQPTQANVEYNVELVRKATFDFAGIADAGGSTLTLIDSELSEYPDDYWNDYELIIMSGSNAGQKRVICDFDQASYTITLCSSFDNSIVSDDKYVISHERKLVHAVWNWSERTLTSGLNIAGDIWSYTGGRTLTSIGSLAVDIWNDTFAPSRRLTDKTLTGGGSLATESYLDTLKSDLIAEINENQTLIENLSSISAADVWSYGARGLTETVDLTSTSTKAIWDIAKAELTTTGSIGKQIADNLDAAVSTRSTLTAAEVWNAATRTLTDYAFSSISLAVWSEATRELTNYGNNITAADIWNVLSGTLALENSIGKQLAEGVDVAVSTRASQASIDALNNISATDVWSYANKGLTEDVGLTATSTDAIWEYALDQIGNTGSIGKLLKDNINATISSRSSHTAADVWSVVTRTLTSNANFNDPDSATIAAAVWSEATRELTDYGNDIMAQDVWNILASNLTTEGTIGKQLATNVDAAVSTRSTLTAADVWGYTNRTLTSFGTLVADIWNYSTRSLTTFGTLVADIWNSTTRTLTSALLGGGGQIVTIAGLNTLKSDLITEINENQTLIENLSSISAADVWSYGTRGLTETVDLTSTSTKEIWDVAKAELTTTGSIGKQIADNLDVAVSTRSTLTAADVWSDASRTLTDYATSSISLTVWSEATRELTSYGNDITAQDVWNVLSDTLALENSIGKQLATNVDTAVSTRASQASIDALNNISATDVWSYANRSITDPDVIWEYALAQIGDTGSIGKLLKDNINATISSRSSHTAADVWSVVTRTLTSNANFNDPNSATIAAAVWSEATRELTNYGNNITAQDVWNILSANLTTTGTIGKQLATNVDVAVSTRSTLTAANVWEYTNRTLTDFGTLVADIWNYSNRTLTSIGFLAADIWNNTFAPTRKLTSRQIAENEYLAGVSSTSIVEQVAEKSAMDITKYNIELVRKATFDFAGIADGGSTATLVDAELDQPDDYWNNYELIMMSGSNIGQRRAISGFNKATYTITVSSAFPYTVASGDKYVISRESKLANAIWNYTSRTLTANTNLGISTTTPAQIADAIWDEALSDHLAAGSTGKALSAAGTGAGVGGGLVIETHTVSEFEQGATGTAVIQVKNNGIPVTGVTPTGQYYNTTNTLMQWPSATSTTVNFTAIGSTGIYYHDFDTTGATLGVYKLAVQAAQSTGGSSYSYNFSDNGNCTTTGWANTGGTYIATSTNEGGQVCVYRKADYGGFMYAFSTAAGNQADFTYSAKVRMDSLTPGGQFAASDYVGITFRYANSSQNYDFYFRKGSGNVRLRKNGATLQESPAGTAWSSDVWYTMKVVVTGGHIQGYVDDVLKVDYTDSSPLPEGMIGMMTYNSVGSWDDISVTAPGTSQYAYIAKDFAIVSPKATQVSIENLNNISATDVWNAGARTLTDYATSSIAAEVWKIATTTLTTMGSVGKHLVDNLDVKVSSVGGSSLTAADVWTYATRALTDYATSSIATAVWESATRELTNYGNNITAQNVWDVLTSSLTTVDSIGKAFMDNRVINFSANGEVLAGSGTDNYRAKLYIYNLASQLVNANATPTITIYNPARSAFVTNANMSKPPTGECASPCTGIYEYVTTIGAGLPAGRWESVVTITTVAGASPIKISGYFEVESSPAQVKINEIVDKTVPSIVANVTIKNEGSVWYEYHYAYCVVDTIGNICDGVDDIDYAVDAIKLDPGQSWTGGLGLTVPSPGTYWYKLVVYWGTEKSVAIRQFDAVSAEVPPTPSPPGGGGGVVPPPPEVCTGADFNKDGIVNSVDFSILLYFWKTQPPFRNPCVDINKDGQVNSIDFSILLYQWGKPGTNISWYNSNKIKNLL